MALRVLTSEAVEAADLPLAELAARMRQPEGWANIPDLTQRLESRLRAALLRVERYLGRVLIGRQLVLVGRAEGCEVRLPVRPVGALVSVEVDRGAGFEALSGARIDDEALVLAGPVSGALRVTVQAGYGAWGDVPADLGEVVLLIAERGETGDREMDPEIRQAIAPFRSLRLGPSA